MLLAGPLSPIAVDIVFTRCKAPGHKRIALKEFLQALAALAEEAGLEFGEVRDALKINASVGPNTPGGLARQDLGPLVYLQRPAVPTGPNAPTGLARKELGPHDYLPRPADGGARGGMGARGVWGAGGGGRPWSPGAGVQVDGRCGAVGGGAWVQQVAAGSGRAAASREGVPPHPVASFMRPSGVQPGSGPGAVESTDAASRIGLRGQPISSPSSASASIKQQFVPASPAAEAPAGERHSAAQRPLQVLEERTEAAAPHPSRGGGGGSISISPLSSPPGMTGTIKDNPLFESDRAALRTRRMDDAGVDRGGGGAAGSGGGDGGSQAAAGGMPSGGVATLLSRGDAVQLAALVSRLESLEAAGARRQRQLDVIAAQQAQLASEVQRLAAQVESGARDGSGGGSGQAAGGLGDKVEGMAAQLAVLEGGVEELRLKVDSSGDGGALASVEEVGRVERKMLERQARAEVALVKVNWLGAGSTGLLVWQTGVLRCVHRC